MCYGSRVVPVQSIVLFTYYAVLSALLRLFILWGNESDGYRISTRLIDVKCDRCTDRHHPLQLRAARYLRG